ncbi:hypothetical protein AVEN_103547-1 [Araneus ventricosus]|uniref:Inorganic phosphate cotransporter n=1 Tax=Araneus ventricosus TaxID=182803 RepID=A0A4Y2NUU3_ARAVE|nr:hypothetical protein AVEN_103547-1 [Araneus ventricosus]
MSIKTFLAKHGIFIVEHQPYSPDLAQRDFFLFPIVKSVLTGTRFGTVESAQNCESKKDGGDKKGFQEMASGPASNSGTCIGFSAAVLGIYFSGCNGHMSAVIAAVSMFFTGVGTAGSMITSLDMAPRFAGSLSAFTHGAGNWVSFLLPIIVGAITKNKLLKEWHIVFFISISFVMMSGIVFAIFGSAKVQPWNFVEEEVDKDINTEEINTEKEIAPES